MLQYFIPMVRYPFVGQESDCPVCGSADHQRIANVDRKLKLLSTHVCNHCGRLFHNPMPTGEELSKYYSDTYRFEYQFLRKALSQSHLARKNREVEKRIDQIGKVADLDTPLRSLDFGCGSGELVRRLGSMGHAAEGIEPGVSFSEHASKEAGGTAVVHSAGWNEMQFSPGSFDLITCLHVLEHLNRPLEALEKMADWLAPGGILFVEVPNMEGYSTKGFDRLHFAHTIGFSRDNLIHALQQSGFAVLHERGPTSIFCVKDGDPRGVDAGINLSAAAARIRSSYSEPLNVDRYLARHASRLRYVIGIELAR